jgi:acetyl-CoA carboxylase carboxyltransferase component
VDEVSKAIRFVRLAAAARVPLIFLPNTAQLVEAVATGPSPMITIVVGGAHDRSMRPRFLFRWPNAATAVDESGQVHDDGVIDPRDTRTVLGICLSVLPVAACAAGRAA